MNTWKIGVLGSGVVGTTLADGLLKHGFDVMVGTRDEAKLADWKGRENWGKVGDFAQTAAFGELLILAAKGTAALDVLTLAGAANLDGKPVIDATNPIADAAPQNGVLHYFTDFEQSLMERLQNAFPKARFVKAFSCIGNGFMVNPDFGGLRPTMFICGNDVAAKNAVREITELFGFDTEDMGEAESARAIEPLAMLWCIPGLREERWTHAFKLLKL